MAAELLGVSVEDILLWDDKGSPPIAEAYLLLWDKKHVNYEGWNGFYFSRGKLRYKKLMWSAELLLRNYDYSQENLILQRRLAKLESWRGVFGLFGVVFVRSFKRFVERVKRF